MSLVERAKEIILKPQETWEKIKGEETTIKELYTSYAGILALIPAIASFIGMSLIGTSFMGFHYRAPIIISLPLSLCRQSQSLDALPWM